MADYIAIEPTQTDPLKPLTSNLVKQLEENPRAIAEGAPGAPSVAPNLAATMVAGELGSFAFARPGNDVGFGALVAGSSIFPASAAVSCTGTVSLTNFGLSSGAALSGTWQCLGNGDAQTLKNNSNSAGTINGATLFLRVA